MSQDIAALLYLAASVCFIMALKGLSSPQTSRAGNFFGMAGMVIAIVTTLVASVTPGVLSYGTILAGIVIGGGAGTFIAQRVLGLRHRHGRPAPVPAPRRAARGRARPSPRPAA